MSNILLEEMPHATEIASVSGLSYTYTFKGGLENSESFFFFFSRGMDKQEMTGEQILNYNSKKVC